MRVHFDYGLMHESAKHVRATLYNPKLFILASLVLREAQLAGMLRPAPSRVWTDFVWTAMPQIDDEKASKAEENYLRIGTISYTDAVMERHGKRARVTSCVVELARCDCWPPTVYHRSPTAPPRAAPLQLIPELRQHHDTRHIERHSTLAPTGGSIVAAYIESRRQTSPGEALAQRLANRGWKLHCTWRWSDRSRSSHGLADDDHPQYLLTNGSRAMTGSLTISLALAMQRSYSPMQAPASRCDSTKLLGMHTPSLFRLGGLSFRADGQSMVFGYSYSTCSLLESRHSDRTILDDSGREWNRRLG